MHCPNCLNIVLRFCSSCSVFVSNSFWLTDLGMRKKPAASRPDVSAPAASLPEHVALEDCPPSEPKRRTKKKSSSDEHPRKRPAEFRPGVEPPRKRPAASLPDNVAGEASPFYGTLVAECIAVNTQRLGAPAEKELMEKLLRRTWTTSGACSGSGMAEVAFSAFMDHFGADHSCHFMCEKESRKQHFLNETATIYSPGEMHIFNDISTLHSGVGACAGHGTTMTCEVSRRADLFTCGFSCKDFSKLSNRFTAMEKSRILREFLGTSGATFKGMIQHADLARPRVIVLENVDEFKEGSENADALWWAMEQIGYVGNSRVFNSGEYGSPQGRLRRYFILLDHQAFGLECVDARALAKRMLDSSNLFVCPPLPLSRFMLDNQDRYVRDELKRRTAAARGDATNTKWQDIIVQTCGLRH